MFTACSRTVAVMFSLCSGLGARSGSRHMRFRTLRMARAGFREIWIHSATLANSAACWL